MKDIFMLSIPGLLQFIFISKRDLGAAGEAASLTPHGWPAPQSGWVCGCPQSGAWERGTCHRVKHGLFTQAWNKNPAP